MLILIFVLLINVILTYSVIRGGTMNKSPKEIEDELEAESKWLKEKYGGQKFWKKHK